MRNLFKAFFIMLKAHRGQFDKSGKCYYFHPINVAFGVKGIKKKTVALLHDVLEDRDLYSINDFNFLDNEQLEALELLNHRKNEDYMVYIERIKSNDIAKAVKLSDLRHNSNLKRLKNITEKDISRKQKYNLAIKFLNE